MLTPFYLPNNGKVFTQAIQETSLHSYSFWEGHHNCSLIQLKRQYGITKGLAIYKRFKGRIETWAFSRKNPREISNAVTQFSIALFQDFISYFDTKETSTGLLSHFVSYPVPFYILYIQPTLVCKEKFKNSLQIKKFILSIGKDCIALSKREWECLSQLAHGKTYKKVSNTLTISPRTVESHLNHIKDRTEVDYKAELITLFHQNKPNSYF